MKLNKPNEQMSYQQEPSIYKFKIICTDKYKTDSPLRFLAIQWELSECFARKNEVVSYIVILKQIKLISPRERNLSIYYPNTLYKIYEMYN